jgi:hypothetical protein
MGGRVCARLARWGRDRPIATRTSCLPHHSALSSCMHAPLDAQHSYAFRWADVQGSAARTRSKNSHACIHCVLRVSPVRAAAPRLTDLSPPLLVLRCTHTHTSIWGVIFTLQGAGAVLAALPLGSQSLPGKAAAVNAVSERRAPLLASFQALAGRVAPTALWPAVCVCSALPNLAPQHTSAFTNTRHTQALAGS